MQNFMWENEFDLVGGKVGATDMSAVHAYTWSE
jgi:hypothetical protein